MSKALIVFASLTGNTEELAYSLADELQELEVTTKVIECTRTNPAEFLEYDMCVVATYTYGSDGDLPDEIIPFFNKLSEVDLSGKAYAVLGFGGTFYEKFCQSVDDFDRQFKKTGAVKAGKSIKIDYEITEKDEEDLTEMARDLLEKHRQLDTVKH